jgi:GTP-binding protein HflX
LVRQVRLPDNRQLLLSDTVGFIDRLPHALVAAFRATREEVADADLLLHVLDAAAADRERRREAVRHVLADMGALEVPLIEVFSKIDRLSDEERRRLSDLNPGTVSISATERIGLDGLIDRVASRVELDVRRITATFDANSSKDRETIGRIYRQGRVLAHETSDGRVSIVADVPRRLLERLNARAS